MWKELLLAAVLLCALFALYQVLPLQEKIEIRSGMFGMKKFSSEEEFREYFSRGRYYEGYAPGYMGVYATVRKAAAMSEVSQGIEIEEGEGIPERVGETTVQVKGIDEPDILKTDGKRIYFSSSYWPRKTYVINAYPPEELAVLGNLSESGNLLLLEDTLVVLSSKKITGYDKENLKKKWELRLNASIVDARLYEGKIYVVVREWVNEYVKCPIHIMRGKNPVLLECTDIYYPTKPISADSVYYIFAIDSGGKILRTVSFAGKYGHSVVYMSKNAIYVAYPFSADYFTILADFIEKNQDLFPSEITGKIKKLEGYEISAEGKFFELTRILEKWAASLSGDERLRIENEMNNRMRRYFEENVRSLERTGIVKLDLNLNILATGEVPGYLLNQWAMDEYEGYLRVATTLGRSFWFSSGESKNDVYVLDENLRIVGSVKDLGITERIYAVRFIGERGYVVTFRETDPFYVLDLSDPRAPKLKGELKIPGYSSYLHPIGKYRILGIGKEGSKVKISLFDVSDAANPKELDKYILEEYWSDVLSTHHAFLLDPEKRVFFLPGRKGGYVFSYENDELKLVKGVEAFNARRATYIDYYLYILSERKVSVIDENTWERVNELSFGEVYLPVR